jgi:hypothetical protein
MIKLIQFLLTGCWHSWEVFEKKQIYNYGTKIVQGQEEVPLPISTKYIMRCKHCGEMKTFDSMKVW